MPRLPRVILFAVVGFIGLVFLVAAALLLFVDANVFKARLEATASEAFGMEVSIDGKVEVGLFPALHVTIGDMHIRNRGVDLASAREASLGIDLLPLLKNEVRIEKIALKQTRLSIARDRAGKFNFDNPQPTGGTLPAVDWPDVSVSGGVLIYADERFGRGFEAGDCSLDLHHLRISGGKRLNLMRALAFTAKLTCGEVRSEGFSVSDATLSVDAKNGVFDIKPITMQVFETQGSGSIHADFSSAFPVYRVHYSLSQFPIEAFFKTISLEKVAGGRMDFSANLSLQGKTETEMRQTLKGQISLRGKGLTLSGSDLDREFSRFESSQNFNLVDVGAFFFVGPLGLVVTKGYNFARVLQRGEGSSDIRTLVSDWKVERGLARALDVAMATKENRIALQGGLDLVNNQFDDVTVALIDAKGCAKVRQKILGTFQNPVVEKPSLLKALTGPALRLLQKGSEFLFDGQCEVFYAGSVAAPT